MKSSVLIAAMVSLAWMSGTSLCMASSGQMSGMVVSDSGGNPLSDIDVAVYRWTGFWWDQVGWGYTEADGTYIITDILPGAYRVEFMDWSGGEYVTAVYDGAHTLDRGRVVLLPASGSVAGIDASLQAASKLSGRVLGPDGIIPLQGISVSAYRGAGTRMKSVGWSTTDDEGYYTIGGLPAGTYRVRFTDWDGNYAQSVYDGATALSSGTAIVLPPETTITGIDASLALASKISGTVYGPDGTTPLADIAVEVRRWTGTWWDYVDGWATTDTEGEYVFSGLGSGTYRVGFRDWNGEYLSIVYDGATDVESGKDIEAPAETTVSGIDASLELASKISGTVYGPDGTTPLANIDVEVRVRRGTWWDYVSGWASTDANGVFVYGGLEPGTYRVGFRDWSGEYLSAVYGGATDIESGEDIEVPAGTTVPGIDASLGWASKISGTVTALDGTTPLSGVEIQVRRWTGTWWGHVDGWTTTDADGEYVFGGLEPGTYRVNFSHRLGDFVPRYYDGAADIESGEDIEVPAGTTVPGIDASLGLASKISGAVYGPDGTTPLAGIDVGVRRWTGTWWDYVDGWATTDAEGEYIFGGLEPGIYRVGFTDWTGEHFSRYYDGATELDDADDIVVSDNMMVTGINAIMLGREVVRPVIVGFRHMGSNMFEVDFVGVMGQAYILQKRTCLKNSWSVHGTPVDCGEDINTIQAESNESTMFWRLREIP